MTFVNDFSPFLFHFKLGGHDIGLRYYGLAYIAGFVFAAIAFKKAIRDGLLPGATEKTGENLTTAIIIGVLAGGRLGYVIQNLGSWAKDPLFPIRIWEGGMAFFGGLVGVILALAYIAKKEKIAFWALTDVATLPAMLGLAFGRIANFINAELWGRPTNANWGVIYPHVDRLPRHPSELYESVSHFLGFAILFIASTRPWARGNAGRLSGLYLVVYGLFRFLTDFFRDEPLAGPLNTGQYASLVVMVLGLILLAFKWKDALPLAPSRAEEAPPNESVASVENPETIKTE